MVDMGVGDFKYFILEKGVVFLDMIISKISEFLNELVLLGMEDLYEQE